MDAKRDISLLNPAWDERTDARMCLLNKLINSLGTCLIQFLFLRSYLLDEEWWETYRPHIIPGDRDIYRYEFWVSTRWSLIISIFSSLESSLRAFLRAIDANACKGGTAAFESIYKCLLNSCLKADYSSEIEALDLFRLIRNTIHNNNIFFDTREKDREVVYRGSRFVFRHGRKVDFVTWEMLVELIETISALAVKVVQDEPLGSLPALYDPMFDLG